MLDVFCDIVEPIVASVGVGKCVVGRLEEGRGIHVDEDGWSFLKNLRVHTKEMDKNTISFFMKLVYGKLPQMGNISSNNCAHLQCIIHIRKVTEN